jgi:site-specific DNA recombinase
MGALTVYVTDRKTCTEIEHLLGLLLSQGRAVGISRIAHPAAGAGYAALQRQLSEANRKVAALVNAVESGVALRI